MTMNFFKATYDKNARRLKPYFRSRQSMALHEKKFERSRKLEDYALCWLFMAVLLFLFGTVMSVKGGLLALTQDGTTFANKGLRIVLINGVQTSSINFGADVGGTVQLTAAPNSGSFFFEWAGDQIDANNQLSSTIVITIAANEDLNITYLFSGAASAPNAGFGDLDGDDLVDVWERVYNLDARALHD